MFFMDSLIIYLINIFIVNFFTNNFKTQYSNYALEFLQYWREILNTKLLLFSEEATVLRVFF